MKKKELYIIGFLVLLSLLGIGLFYLLNSTSEALWVRVSINGETVSEYPLNENRTETIETDSGFNTLVIKDHTADISDANCPDRICVKTYPISSPGETIVCLPHKLIVEIVTGD